ncbi:hypothetical protein DFP81_101115 [Marinomonas pollencensis]|uniref:Uncharacterized protein n=1 Tax=Marinomonas pollencensis TaxID=491954 RepID=A0A3E0DSU2_9GAMM|nr:hypothetical protein DFP81_101115 [Marinomonas pollencensis]
MVNNEGLLGDQFFLNAPRAKAFLWWASSEMNSDYFPEYVFTLYFTLAASSSGKIFRPY